MRLCGERQYPFQGINMANEYYISAGLAADDNSIDGVDNCFYMSAGLVPDDVPQGSVLPIIGELASKMGMTANLSGQSGIVGGLDTAFIRTSLQQNGQLGISGELDAEPTSLGIKLLQISKSEPVSRIGMAVQSGSVAFPGPEFGKIEISTVIS